MSYLWTGYAVTWIAIAWYAWRLERRADRAGRRLEHTRPVRDEPSGSRSRVEREISGSQG